MYLTFYLYAMTSKIKIIGCKEHQRESLHTEKNKDEHYTNLKLYSYLEKTVLIKVILKSILKI